ncbi:hypothetical protein [Yinghuangia sp. YIM S09857]|uniref:hypothetical protein n=1 Tax=Yinghuangia sp. YIM S09857 TaxID=3436929 RepID=UPI003F53C1DC
MIRDRHQAVCELLAQGRSLRGVSRDLDLDYHAVRRYARTVDVEELPVKVTQLGRRFLDSLAAVLRRPGRDTARRPERSPPASPGRPSRPQLNHAGSRSKTCGAPNPRGEPRTQPSAPQVTALQMRALGV